MVDITAITKILIVVIAAVVTIVIIPWVRAKLSDTQLEIIMKWAKIAVKAAEQLSKTGEIDKDQRREYVEKFLRSKGYTIDLKEIEILIEGMVNDLPKEIEQGVLSEGISIDSKDGLNTETLHSS